MNLQLLISCVVVSLLSTITGCLPVKQWSKAPSRQPHWTGFQNSKPAYLLTKSPTLTAQYEKFLKTKGSGELHPRATFRPDSWSHYNYHVEKREENKAICNVSETPNNYCPKTSERSAEELRMARNALLSGTTIAAIFGVGMAIVYFINYNFFSYFDYKERWHVERSRLRAVRKINRSLARTGLDNPFAENVDPWLLNHPPSRFWASVFESELFIALLYFIEHRTQANGKFTGIMNRPKLGDEASGVPLNSPQARRRYRNGRIPVSTPYFPSSSALALIPNSHLLSATRIIGDPPAKLLLSAPCKLFPVITTKSKQTSIQENLKIQA